MIKHSLQIQVLYEIAMSIGNETNLFDMLQNSLSVLLRNLNCSAGAVIEYEKKKMNGCSITPIATIPRNIDNLPVYQSALRKISSQLSSSEMAEFIKKLPDTGTVKNQFYYLIMELPGFGFLILIKANTPLEQQMIYSLKPIAEKLSGACIACRQNEKTAQLVEELKIENTERRKAEDALKKSYELFKTVLDSIDATIYVSDMNTYEIIFANQHMKNCFDHELEGEICYRIFRNERQPCAHCTNSKLINKAGNILGVYTWEDQNPITRKWYLNFDRAINWIDGRTVRLQIATDITRLKDLEGELRHSHKMESIGTLAGGIAHDFNNILFMISGNAELLLEDIPKWEPTYKSVEEIKSASMRAAGIVKQLLNFSRKTDQNLIPVDALNVIEDSLNFLRSSIPSTIEVQKKLLISNTTILADPVQINQVLMNICTNASQAMEETGGVLRIEAKIIKLDNSSAEKYLELKEDVYLNIEIIDSGPGIAPEAIDKIFDPYFTTKEFGKGSGMGLAVVHGIIKNHKGSITVNSQIGEGTTFTILLPLIDEKPHIEIKEADQQFGGLESILFVDDEASIVDMSSRMLIKNGYKVTTRTDPVEALELFRSIPGSFDLVITDMTMPQMTGVKLSEKLMEIRSDIPVIICTGHSSLIDEEKAKNLGIAGYIMKPVSMSNLTRSIRDVIDNKFCTDF